MVQSTTGVFSSPSSLCDIISSSFSVSGPARSVSCLRLSIVTVTAITRSLVTSTVLWRYEVTCHPFLSSYVTRIFALKQPTCPIGHVSRPVLWSSVWQRGSVYWWLSLQMAWQHIGLPRHTGRSTLLQNVCLNAFECVPVVPKYIQIQLIILHDMWMGPSHTYDRVIGSPSGLWGGHTAIRAEPRSDQSVQLGCRPLLHWILPASIWLL